MQACLLIILILIKSQKGVGINGGFWTNMTLFLFNNKTIIINSCLGLNLRFDEEINYSFSYAFQSEERQHQGCNTDHNYYY